ncbi:VCBS repeat-containing protein [Alphaproteobacteria bacterium]|nr:VCBS repeat-containing protein [Alphaproteobacteria bacterium]
MKYQLNNLLIILLGTCHLSGCISGGGGSYNQSISNNVYYTVPVKQTTVDPFVGGNENSPFIGDTFITDLDGDGASDDIVIAGRETQPETAGNWNNSRLSVHSFENGSLVDKTSQWFFGTDNEIIGTEPSVKFADFFNTGRQDIIVTHSQDMQSYGPATFFKNNGSNFTKISIPTANIWSHGNAVGDLNNDGYKDVFMLDYGWNSTVALNNQVNSFTTKVDSRGVFGDLRFGGSGTTIGNFMNNGGNNEIIVTDAACPTNGTAASCSNNNDTKMFSVDFSGGDVRYTWVADLPDGANSTNTDHHVRVVNHDYNEDGNADVIVFSLDSDAGDNKLSNIQFLQNDGSGTFTDTTSTTLIGYQTNTSSTYKPRFFDINGDGKTDILVSGGTHGTNDSHQFLLKTTDNKYVAAYQNVLQGFITDVASISGNTTLGSTVNIFTGDDGNKYLVTWASTALQSGHNDTKIFVFMSRLDGTTIAAGTAINMIQNAWSYLSYGQAAQALSDTGQSFMGGTIIDINEVFQPIGKLSMGGLEINGNIYGFDIGNVSGQALDVIGRNYEVNLASMNIENNGATMYNSIASFRARTKESITFGADDTTQQFTIGYNLWTDTNEEICNSIAYSLHMSKFNSNPWIGFSGVWGEVESSNIIDNVLTYKQGEFTAKASIMHVRTNFKKGLIKDVSDQFGTWGEVSFEKSNFKIDVGIHPLLLQGNVKATIPSSINIKGELNYTDYKYNLPKILNGYLKTSYNLVLDKNSNLQFSNLISQTSFSNAQINYNYNW